MNEAYELDATVFLETFMIFECTNAFKEVCLVNYKTAKRFEEEINISTFCYFERNVV
jgi:hypothetical protein